MTANEYVELANRTNDNNSTQRINDWLSDDTVIFNWSKGKIVPSQDRGGLINACLGLSGEVGEFNDMIKKWIFHEKKLNMEHAKKELGDIMWYISLMCKSFNWDLDEILQMNVDKLKKRYPDGFDIIKANHREKNDI